MSARNVMRRKIIRAASTKAGYSGLIEHGYEAVLRAGNINNCSKLFGHSNTQILLYTGQRIKVTFQHIFLKLNHNHLENFSDFLAVSRKYTALTDPILK